MENKELLLASHGHTAQFLIPNVIGLRIKQGIYLENDSPERQWEQQWQGQGHE